MNWWLISWFALAYRTIRKRWARVTHATQDNDSARRHAGFCAWCSTMQLRHNPVNGSVDGWCGEPGRSTAQSCGCVVLTIDRRDAAKAVAENPDRGERLRRALVAVSRPDGKTAILGEKCPKGLW